MASNEKPLPPGGSQARLAAAEKRLREAKAAAGGDRSTLTPEDSDALDDAVGVAAAEVAALQREAQENLFPTLEGRPKSDPVEAAARVAHRSIDTAAATATRVPGEAAAIAAAPEVEPELSAATARVARERAAVAGEVDAIAGTAESDPKKALERAIQEAFKEFKPRVPKWTLDGGYEIKAVRDAALSKAAMSRLEGTEGSAIFLMEQQYLGDSPYSTDPAFFSVEVMPTGEMFLSYQVNNKDRLDPPITVSTVEGIEEQHKQFTKRVEKFIEEKRKKEKFDATLPKVIDIRKPIDGKNLRLADKQPLVLEGVGSFVNAEVPTEQKIGDDDSERVYTLRFKYKERAPGKSYGQEAIFHLNVAGDKVRYEYEVDHLVGSGDTNSVSDIRAGFNKFNEILGSYCNMKNLVERFSKTTNEWKLADGTNLELPATQTNIIPETSKQTFDTKNASVYTTEYKYTGNLRPDPSPAKFSLRTSKNKSEVVFYIAQGEPEQTVEVKDVAAIKAVFDNAFLPAVDKFVADKAAAAQLQEQVRNLAAAETKFVQSSADIHTAKLKLADGKNVRLETPDYLRAAAMKRDPQAGYVDYTITQAYKDQALGDATFRMRVTADGKFQHQQQLSAKDRITGWTEVDNALQMHEAVAEYYQALETAKQTRETKTATTELQRNVERFISKNGVAETARRVTLRNRHSLYFVASTVLNNGVMRDKTVGQSRTVTVEQPYLNQAYSTTPAEFKVTFTKDSARAEYTVNRGGAHVELDLTDPADLETFYGAYTTAVEAFATAQQTALDQARTTEASRALKDTLNQFVDVDHFTPNSWLLRKENGRPNETEPLPTQDKPFFGRARFSQADNGSDARTFTLQHSYRDATAHGAQPASFAVTINRAGAISVEYKYNRLQTRGGVRQETVALPDVSNVGGIKDALEAFYAAAEAGVAAAPNAVEVARAELDTAINRFVDVAHFDSASNTFPLRREGHPNQTDQLPIQSRPFLRPAVLSRSADGATFSLRQGYVDTTAHGNRPANFTITFTPAGEANCSYTFTRIDRSGAAPTPVSETVSLGNVENVAGIRDALTQFYAAMDRGVAPEVAPVDPRAEVRQFARSHIQDFHAASGAWKFADGSLLEQPQAANAYLRRGELTIDESVPDRVIYSCDNPYIDVATGYSGSDSTFNVMFGKDGSAPGEIWINYHIADGVPDVGPFQVDDIAGIRRAHNEYYSAVDRFVTEHRQELENQENRDRIHGQLIGRVELNRIVLQNGRGLQLGFDRANRFFQFVNVDDRYLTDHHDIRLQYEYRPHGNDPVSGDPVAYSHTPASFDVVFNADGTAVVRYQVAANEQPVEQPVTTPAEVEQAFQTFSQATEQFCLAQERIQTERTEMNAVQFRYIAEVNPNARVIRLRNGDRIAPVTVGGYLDQGTFEATNAGPGGPREYTFTQPYRQDDHGHAFGQGQARFILQLARGEQVVRYQVADDQPEQRRVVQNPVEVRAAYIEYQTAIRTTVEAARIGRAEKPGARELSRRMRTELQHRQDTDRFASRTAIEAALAEPNSELNRHLQSLLAELSGKTVNRPGEVVDFMQLRATTELAQLLGINPEQVRDILVAQDAQVYERAKLAYQAEQSPVKAGDGWFKKAGKIGFDMFKKIGTTYGIGAAAGLAVATFASAPAALGAVGGVALYRVIDGIRLSFKEKRGIATKEAELRAALRGDFGPEIEEDVDEELAALAEQAGHEQHAAPADHHGHAADHGHAAPHHAAAEQEPAPSVAELNVPQPRQEEARQWRQERQAFVHQLREQIIGALAVAKRQELEGRMNNSAVEQLMTQHRGEYINGQIDREYYDAYVRARADGIRLDALDHLAEQFQITDYITIRDEHNRVTRLLQDAQNDARAAGVAETNLATDPQVVAVRQSQDFIEAERQWQATIAPIEPLATGARNAYLQEEINQLYQEQHPRTQANRFADRQLTENVTVGQAAERVLSLATLGRGNGGLADRLAQSAVGTVVGGLLIAVPGVRRFTMAMAGARVGAWAGERGVEALGLDHEITSAEVRALPAEASANTMNAMLGRLVTQLQEPAFIRKHTTRGQLSAEYRALQAQVEDLQDRLVAQMQGTITSVTAVNDQFEATRVRRRNADAVRTGAKVVGALAGGIGGAIAGEYLNDWLAQRKAQAAQERLDQQNKAYQDYRANYDAARNAELRTAFRDANAELNRVESPQPPQPHQIVGEGGRNTGATWVFKDIIKHDPQAFDLDPNSPTLDKDAAHLSKLFAERVGLIDEHGKQIRFDKAGQTAFDLPKGADGKWSGDVVQLHKDGAGWEGHKLGVTHGQLKAVGSNEVAWTKPRHEESVDETLHRLGERAATVQGTTELPQPELVANNAQHYNFINENLPKTDQWDQLQQMMKEHPERFEVAETKGVYPEHFAFGDSDTGGDHEATAVHKVPTELYMPDRQPLHAVKNPASGETVYFYNEGNVAHVVKPGSPEWHQLITPYERLLKYNNVSLDNYAGMEPRHRTAIITDLYAREQQVDALQKLEQHYADQGVPARKLAAVRDLLHDTEQSYEQRVKDYSRGKIPSYNIIHHTTDGWDLDTGINKRGHEVIHIKPKTDPYNIERQVYEEMQEAIEAKYKLAS